MNLGHAPQPEPGTSGRPSLSRGSASPAVLLLFALTVQVCVGGPAWAAAVVRHEVAAQRDGARLAAAAVPGTFAGLLATQREVAGEIELPGAGSPKLVGRVLPHAACAVALHESVLPPPAG